MLIKDLTPEYESLYFQCLEDWSDEVKESGCHKEQWYCKMRDKGLRVKLALGENGMVGGMIQYTPVEYNLVEGKDLYYINCIWVHGHKQGRGNFQHHGMGKALLQSAEEDVKILGAKGIVAWGVILPFFMRASWFKKQGYKKADRDGIQMLLWKPFDSNVTKPTIIRQKKKPEVPEDKVTVTGFLNGWCPGQNMAFERARRAASEFGDKVVFNEINTASIPVMREWGISDALFIDKKQVWTGPPPSYQKIRNKIVKALKKKHLL